MRLKIQRERKYAPLLCMKEWHLLLVFIDRILDMLRTSVTVVGNALASIVMSKWEGSFDKEKAKQYINTIKETKAA